MKKFIALFAAQFIVLSGCASNSGVVKIGQEKYMVSRQAATGFTGVGTLKAEAMAECNIYCESIGKDTNFLTFAETRPPYIFGHFPRADVTFECVETTKQ